MFPYEDNCHFDVLKRELDLDLDFEFSSLTGKINIMTGSGLSGPADISGAHNDIAFSYDIDNSGDLERTVTITFEAAAVHATVTRGSTGNITASGGVKGEEGELGLEGSCEVSYTLTSDAGVDGVRTGSSVVLKLLSTEPAP